MSDDPPETVVTALRQDSGEVGRAVGAWLDEIGYRVFSGFDVADLYVLETPGTIVRTVREALAGVRAPARDESDRATADLRAKVPSEFHEQFDDMLAEARHVYGIRGVVGTRDATSRIADGDTIEVDGDEGVVRILAG